MDGKNYPWNASIGVVLGSVIALRETIPIRIWVGSFGVDLIWGSFAFSHRCHFDRGVVVDFLSSYTKIPPMIVFPIPINSL